MKKAIFSTEISLLRSTMQRLLRRRAHTNISKILRKTHQADVALIMRSLSPVSYTHLTLPTKLEV